LIHYDELCKTKFTNKKLKTTGLISNPIFSDTMDQKGLLSAEEETNPMTFGPFT
jgi:hypothetical protein